MVVEKSRTNVYLDTNLKEQAKEIYKHYGLSLSEAVNMFLAQSVFNRGLPFEVKIPNDMTLEKLSSNTLRFEKVFRCEMECYEITDKDIDELFTNGKVLFNHSYPNKKPNPLYFIEKEINNALFVFWIEQGATKTRLNRIVKVEQETNKNTTYAVEYLFSEKPNCNCGQ